MRRSQLSKVPKINMTPVMDAVFIFIFFLMISSQFINFHEIATTIPKVINQESSTDDNTKNKNFKLILKSNKVLVTEGAREKKLAEFKLDDDGKQKLKAFLINLAADNKNEESIIIKPNAKVKYETIVEVIDLAQAQIPDKKQGKRKVFRAIAFESVSE